MDWSKVKNILIVVFIGLNIFLLTFILNDRESRDVFKYAIKDTEKVLTVNGVKLECSIPSYDEQTGRAVKGEYSFDSKKVLNNLIFNDVLGNSDIEYNKEYKSGEKNIIFINGHEFEYKNSKPQDSGVNITTIADAEKYIKSLFKSMDIPLSDFKLEQSLTNDDGSMTLKFVDEYKKDINIFDSKITVNIVSTGVRDIKCNISKIDKVDESAKIIAAYQILLRHFNINGKVIKAVDFGFKADKNSLYFKKNEYAPAWRVELGDGREQFFNAYTGNEIIE